MLINLLINIKSIFFPFTKTDESEKTSDESSFAFKDRDSNIVILKYFLEECLNQTNIFLGVE